MTNRPAWFARSLPYGWHGGRIQVEGDATFKLISLRSLGACLVSTFLWVILVWAIYGWIAL